MKRNADNERIKHRFFAYLQGPLQLDTYARPKSLHSHRYSVHQQWPDYGRNCAAICL